MWNVFKFFFVWFWLAVAWAVAGAIGLVAAGTITNHPTTDTQSPAGAIIFAVVAVAGPLMCIPAYFIARPRRRKDFDFDR